MLNVHQSLLCKSSEFFKRVMKPEWATLREDPNIIDLSDDATDVVSLYVLWLYYDDVRLKLSVPDDKSPANLSLESEKVFVPLASAYVFGEKVMDSRFKNALVFKLLEAITAFGWCPGPAPAIIVYEGTTEGSPMRRLLSDIVACNAQVQPGWVSYIKDSPRELLADALIAMADRRSLKAGRHYRESTASYLEKEQN